MQPAAHAFKRAAHAALDDRHLQSALGELSSGFPQRRRDAVDRLPEFDAVRDRAKEIKDHVLVHLDHYLDRFATRAAAAGSRVHWCATPEDARAAILEICQAAGAKTVTKGKSMVSEEIGLNGHLESHGLEVIETDLGEHIVQIEGEVPSHLIVPAIHKTQDQIADAFLRHHENSNAEAGRADAGILVDEARRLLRQRYFDADVGITGANFLIAETGGVVIVTNEGNGDLTQTLPKVHIVIAGIEKVLPNLDDAATVLRVLARSATGQDITSYTTFANGPKRDGDLDGPDEMHIVLLDNGRSELVGGQFQDILRCIRCGACLNHCPIYAHVGGHSYGWVYSGPMGAVLTPAQLGIEEARDLPHASTLCGRCEEVCPMRIPLPRLLREWRTVGQTQKVMPGPQRWAVTAWAWLAARPRVYQALTGLALPVLAWWGGKAARFRRMPLAGGWTRARDLPAPQRGGTFLHQVKAGKVAGVTVKDMPARDTPSGEAS